MESSSTLDSKLDLLRKSILDGDFSDAEEGWVELVSQGAEAQQHLDGLLELAELLAAQGERDRAATLLELLLPAVSESARGTPSLLRLHELLARLAPDDRSHRAAFIELFETLYPAGTPERAFFDASGIRESADQRKAFHRFASLRKFVPGAVVYHGSGWGIGEVLEVDPLLKQVRVDLAGKKNHRVAIEAADSILQVLPPESFQALEYRDVEALKRMSREEPIQLVEKILESFGNPLPLKDIKARLIPSILTTNAWAKWWAGAKAQLRASGFFRVGDRAPFPVERLRKAISYEDDLVERILSPRWTEKQLAARTVLRDGEAKYPRAVKILREEMSRIATDPAAAQSAVDGERALRAAGAQVAAEASLIAAVFLAQASGDGAEEPALGKVLDTFTLEGLVDMLEGLSQAEEIGVILREFTRRRPDEAVELYRRGFFSTSDPLREEVCRYLQHEISEEQLLLTLADELTRSPRISPEAFAWTVEKRLRGMSEGVALQPVSKLSDRELVGRLMDLLEHLFDRGARQQSGRQQGSGSRYSGQQIKDLFRRLEPLFYHQQGSYLIAAMKDLRPANIREIYSRLMRCADYFPRYGAKLIEVVAIHFPQVFRDKQDAHVWWDNKHIYVTRHGLARRKEEFRLLTDEKLPAVFEAIGRAREFGDLSENAEYTSALEERDLLTKRATQIEEELKKARLIGPEDVRPGPVGLGHRVRVTDLDTNEEKVFSILGPWDGMPEEGVISYRSPLGEVFLGKRVDEEFVADLPGGKKRFVIREVRSHFEN